MLDEPLLMIKNEGQLDLHILVGDIRAHDPWNDSRYDVDCGFQYEDVSNVEPPNGCSHDSKDRHDAFDLGTLYKRSNFIHHSMDNIMKIPSLHSGWMERVEETNLSVVGCSCKRTPSKRKNISQPPNSCKTTKGRYYRWWEKVE